MNELFIGRHFVLLRFGHTIVGGDFRHPMMGNDGTIEEGGREERYNLHEHFFDTEMTRNKDGRVWW